MQLTDSVIQLQQFGSFCHKKLSYYVQNTLNIAHKYMDCFYDNFMILLLCFFWSLKASVTIRCNCFFLKDQIWILPFVFPESKSWVFRTTWGCANGDRIFIFWVNNAFKLSSDVLGNVSYSCKILSTAGFPTGLCLQVIESMWTISWLCNDDTESL